MANRVTIFYEHNVRAVDQKASVWLMPGESDPNKTLDEEKEAVRIIGPIASNLAEDIINGLERALIACGLSVTREITADD